MTDSSFAVFILTHGRSDRVYTYTTLRQQGYTGAIYLIIDNEDQTGDAYRTQYGQWVITFDKTAIAETFDVCDNFNLGHRGVVYARNACWEIARQLGIHYFLVLDDDYVTFEFRLTTDLQYGYSLVRNLDHLFALVLAYYQSIPALAIAFGQNGDLIGGRNSASLRKLAIKRKVMNSFFCSVDRPFRFIGRINEDVNTYLTLGHRGALMFTLFHACIQQKHTQSQSGGLTPLYLEHGTYVKTFYAVMNAPSCVRVGVLRSQHMRIHHHIAWEKAVPLIVSEKYRKVITRSQGDNPHAM